MLALDPGGTTGYAVLKQHGDGVQLVVGEARWSLVEMHGVLDRFINDEIEAMHVIYEDFSYRNASRAGLDLTPVKLIGIIEYFREQFEPFVGFHVQSAATGKAFWSDDKLKKKDIYAKGKKHGRDATRHLMQWLAFGAGSQFLNVDDVAFKLEIE